MLDENNANQVKKTGKDISKRVNYEKIMEFEHPPAIRAALPLVTGEGGSSLNGSIDTGGNGDRRGWLSALHNQSFQFHPPTCQRKGHFDP